MSQHTMHTQLSHTAQHSAGYGPLHCTVTLTVNHLIAEADISSQFSCIYKAHTL